MTTRLREAVRAWLAADDAWSAFANVPVKFDDLERHLDGAYQAGKVAHAAKEELRAALEEEERNSDR